MIIDKVKGKDTLQNTKREKEIKGGKEKEEGSTNDPRRGPHLELREGEGVTAHGSSLRLKLHGNRINRCTVPI